MTDHKLKPCPFCGGEARTEKVMYLDNYRVICKKCPVTLGRYWFWDEQEAIEAWNRRADNDRP